MNQISLQRYLNLYVQSWSTWLNVAKRKSRVSLSTFFTIDVKRLYIHWYFRARDLRDLCSQFDIPDSYNINETCDSCFNGEIGLSWICYLLCN